MKTIFYIAVLIIGSVLIAYSLSGNPHEFAESACPRCHIDSTNRPFDMTAPLTELCLPCHKKISKKMSHPVDRVPELTVVPEDLPLMEGMVTCNTCHNIHEYRFDIFGNKTYFLRRSATGKDFCLSCHEISSASEGHIELVASAHLGNRFTVTDTSQPLDPVSTGCISCHEGGPGRDPGLYLHEGIWDHNVGSHPIGVNYNKSRMRTGDLKDISQVDERVKFFNGSIGCGTCHDIYSGLPAKLVMSNEEGRLCLACHHRQR